MTHDTLGAAAGHGPDAQSALAAARTSARFLIPGAVILLLFLLVITAAFWIRAPLPDDAIHLAELEVSLDGGAFERVTLPHRWPAAGPNANTFATYRGVAPRTPGEPAVLLISGVRHDLHLRVDGQSVQLNASGLRRDSSLGATHVLHLQPSERDVSDIELRLERSTGFSPGYLSDLYLVTEPAFGQVRWAWLVAQSDFHLATQVLHGTVLLGIWLLWLLRRKDPVFSWMALLASAAFLTERFLLLIEATELRLFAVAGFGLIGYAFALALIGAPRPRWVKVSIVLVPALLLGGAQSGLVPPMPAIALSGALAIVFNLMGGFLLLRHAWREAQWDRAAMAFFFLSTAWYGIYDFGVGLGRIDAAWFLSHHMRAFGLLVALFLLMRWLATSLTEVDRANATLNIKLAEQKQELTLLHRKEQVRIREAAQESERKRLMRDLHDGLSGHLVSIIALSENGARDNRLIEDTARAALDDLRVVINSLDLEDDDLRLALSGLRESAEPRLSRLGIRLDWSTAQLPEVRGIKPGNSLAILRILQEAVTNAIKHGDKGPIQVEAGPSSEDGVLLSVTNRTSNTKPGGNGQGLRNMRLRAAELGGEVRFEINGGVARMSLVFPRDLGAPEPEGEPHGAGSA